MRARRFFAPFVCLAGFISLVGCFGLDTSPAVGIIQSVVAEGEALEEYARAAGGESAAFVSGQIVGKLPCDEVQGDLSDSGDNMRLVVTLRADRHACNGVQPTTWSYIVNILNLRSGSRELIVEHRYRGIDGAEGIVLDTLIVVG